MTTILFLFTFLSFAYSLNIVVFITLVGKSHVDFASSLIDQLTERGHNVDFILARMNSHVRSNGTKNVRRFMDFELKSGATPWMKSMHLTNPFQERETSLFKENLMELLTRSMTDLCRVGLQDDKLLDFLRSDHYDIALTSAYDYCSLVLFHASGIENVASISSTTMTEMQTFAAGLPIPPSYIIDILKGHYYGEKMTLWERSVNVMTMIKHELHERPHMIREMDSLSRSRYGPSFPSVSSLSINYSLMFVNSNELLEQPRPISHKIKYIGGINLRKSKKIPAEFDTILSRASRGNVIFSFGTQVNSHHIPLHIRQSFVNAFSQFPDYNFLWKYENWTSESELFEQNDNIIPVDWMPQSDLLHDSRVVAFISHMGLNSLLESSYAGVPMVAIPLFTDQVANAKIAVRHGFAVIVRKTNITEESMVEALRKILGNDEMKLSARRISQMLKKKPENVKNQFIEWVEFAAMFPNLHEHFNLDGSSLNFFVYNCLDVIAVLFLFCLLFLVIAFYIIRKLVTICSNMLKKQKVKSRIE